MPKPLKPHQGGWGELRRCANASTWNLWSSEGVWWALFPKMCFRIFFGHTYSKNNDTSHQPNRWKITRSVTWAVALCLGLPQRFVLGRWRRWFSRCVNDAEGFLLVNILQLYGFAYSKCARLIKRVTAFAFRFNAGRILFTAFWTYSCWAWFVAASLRLEKRPWKRLV